MEGSCIACGEFGVMDRAHIKTRGAGAGWEEWEWMPLCRRHHIQQGAWGWHRFSDKFPSVAAALDERKWHFINEFGRKRLVR